MNSYEMVHTSTHDVNVIDPNTGDPVTLTIVQNFPKKETAMESIE